jgi:hypothetical protein
MAYGTQYNFEMSPKIPAKQSRFDAVLSRMLASKPLSKEEISARIKAERKAKKK